VRLLVLNTKRWKWENFVCITYELFRVCSLSRIFSPSSANGLFEIRVPFWVQDIFSRFFVQENNPEGFPLLNISASVKKTIT